jgi:hypothetical protein
LHCPKCDVMLEKRVKDNGADVMVPCSLTDLSKRPTTCKCGESLYQWTHVYDRWPIADIVQRKRRDAFRYLVIDEAHESKSATTATGHSVGKLCSAIKHKIALTGTLLNGYADSVFPMSFRVMPQNTSKLGIEWGGSMDFVKRYGRIETVTTYKDDEAYANRSSRGSGRTTNVKVKPGIVPSLYGDCLLKNSVFCSLTDLGYKLPKLTEILDPVEMDSELCEAYGKLEDDIRQNLRGAIAAGSKGALATMLNTLIGWPDHPYGFDRIGYTNGDGQRVQVAEPENLDPNVIRNKERKLVEIVMDTVARGRQAWVYCEMTQKRDVQPRIKKLLTDRGLGVEIMRSQSVPTHAREDWIYEHGKSDVIISNPALVKTGLDLFDLGGNHNFSTLIFYQCGYILDTLRQAAKRAYRIGQTIECEVRYLYYVSTMQESVMNLMSSKTQAASAIDGQFSAAGLAAMSGGEGESAAMMLAKMLVERRKLSRNLDVAIAVA